MKQKYNPEIHHRQSIRLKSHDYGESGLYFITICTKDRENLFGRIYDGKMYLSEIGKIIHKEWLNTRIVRPNVDLDDFIIMPNHLHGIIEIMYKVDRFGKICKGELPTSSAGVQYAPTDMQFRSPSQTIGAIIRGFKGAATKQANEYLGDLTSGSIWQRNYYDHIITTTKSLERIRNYMYTNPSNWNQI